MLRYATASARPSLITITAPRNLANAFGIFCVLCILREGRCVQRAGLSYS
jgi:hypothetical protein